MPIHTPCRSCGGRFQAPDAAAGRAVKCPKCGSLIDVPTTRPEDDDPPARPQGKRPIRANKMPETDAPVPPAGEEPRRGGRPNRTVLYLALGGGGLLLLILMAAAGVVILALARDDAKNRPGDGTQTAASTQPDRSNSPGASSSRPTEDEAKAKLKLVLDSWAFGDSPATFEAAHPEVITGVRLHSLDKLTRYEIGAGRPTDRGYEFVVTHVFESASGGEVKRTGTVTLSHFPNGQWLIHGLGGAD